MSAARPEDSARPQWPERLERDLLDVIADPCRRYWRQVARADSFGAAQQIRLPALEGLDRALANAIRAGYRAARAATEVRIRRDLPARLRRAIGRRPVIHAAGPARGDAAAQATEILIRRLDQLLIPEDWVEWYAANRVPPLTWALEEKARRELAARVATGAAQGLAWHDIKRKLRDTYGLGWAHAENVARTELGTMYTNGALLQYTQTDLVTRVQFMAILDSRTTPVCARLNGRVFRVTEATASVTPPLHYQCRSTLSPVLAWEDLRPQSPAEAFAGAGPDEYPLEGFGVADIPEPDPYSVEELLRPDLAEATGAVRDALQWLARGATVGWWVR